MIYSWWWYNRNAVVASLPDSFEEIMENSFIRDLGCFARHLGPGSIVLPRRTFSSFNSTRSGAIPTASAKRAYEFLGIATDFKPQFSQQRKNAARAPRFPLLQSSAQRLYSVLSALPGADKVLKSSVVAKTLQRAYHGLNTKARKYEPLSPQERLKWEAYYAVDQKSLSDLLRELRVVE